MIAETEIINLVKRYDEFIAIPSVSIENSGIEEAVAYLTRAFQEMTADKVEVWRETGGNPVVFAEFKGESAKTILIYNHYDVQPSGDLEEWRTPPFEATYREGRLYGRGASDCKGEIMCRLIAINHLKKVGKLPCNIKFIIEGEEEIGSRHLAADACLWECGWKNEEEHLELACGVKGILSFDLEVTTAEHALHSSLACYIENAAWRLTSALATLKNAHGEITIAGFYDKVQLISEELAGYVEQMDFNESTIKGNYGLKSGFVSDDPKLALVNSPTFNISQLKSGHDLSQNAIPAKASAKIDCRFVPDQAPLELIKLIRNQLDQGGFHDVVIKGVRYEGAFRSDVSTAFISQAVEIAQSLYGRKEVKLVPNLAGGGPMAIFGKGLELPILAAGCSYAQSNVHGPNENIRLRDVAQNVNYLIRLMSSYGQSVSKS